MGMGGDGARGQVRGWVEGPGERWVASRGGEEGRAGWVGGWAGYHDAAGMGRLAASFIQAERVYVCAELRARFKPLRKGKVG